MRRAPRRATAPLPARAIGLIRGLPDLALVDRLLRGRVWIPLLGIMLAGIVAMQVELLKLNSSIGRSIDRGAALQSQNEQLRATVASLGDDQRIERIAAGMGMVMPSPAGVVFLGARPGANVQQAVARMRAPNAATFAALQPNYPTTVIAPAGGAASLGTSARGTGAGATTTAASVTGGASSTTSGTSGTSSGAPAAAGATGATSAGGTGTGAGGAGTSAGVTPASAPSAAGAGSSSGTSASSGGTAAVAPATQPSSSTTGG